MSIFGVRQEGKNAEKRTPFIPAHIEHLTRSYPDLRVLIESRNGSTRVFKNDDYRSIPNVEIVRNLTNCPVVFGVKEIKPEEVEPGITYAFFSHTFKGQPDGMELLKTLMNLKCTLIDYEMLVEDVSEDRLDEDFAKNCAWAREHLQVDVSDKLPRTAFQSRTVHFCRFAGITGMFDSLWALGRRLQVEGLDSPFTDLSQSIEYSDWETAKAEGLGPLRRAIEAGLPARLNPLIIGVTGFSRNGNPGKTAEGAREVLHELGAQELRSPAEPEKLDPADPTTAKKIYYVGFNRDDTADPGRFQGYVRHLTLLVNCIRWMPWEPPILTRRFLRQLYGSESPRLRVIGDVSCDPGGSIRCTLPTTVDNPVFVYNPDADGPENEVLWRHASDHARTLLGEGGPCRYGVEGHGPVVLGVDNLPTQLPRDASEEFSYYTMETGNFPNDKEHPLPYQIALLAKDKPEHFPDLVDIKGISRPLRRALVVYNGKLTPEYRYLEKYLMKCATS